MITECKRPAKGLIRETDHHSDLTMDHIKPNIIRNKISNLRKDEGG